MRTCWRCWSASAMISGSNENSYTLDVPAVADLSSVAYLDRKTLPMAGGVYFVLSALGAVLYVGSSKHLRQRWIGHHRHHQLAEMPGIRIAWVVVEHPGHRLALEHHCIDALRPLYQQRTMPPRQ